MNVDGISKTADLQASLRAALSSDMVLTDPAEMLRFCRDWHGDVTSGAVAVLRPRSPLMWPMPCGPAGICS